MFILPQHCLVRFMSVHTNIDFVWTVKNLTPCALKPDPWWIKNLPPEALLFDP